MKRYILTALAVAALVFAPKAEAQVFPDSYINIDWQLNIPTHNDVADDTSGWGMNFEGGYFLTPEITLGAFISYHTNFEKLPRQTITLNSGAAMTSSQKHALFQLPFGAAARYNWFTDSVVQPYVGLKAGACWSEISSYYYLLKQSTDMWGFYCSPEVGVSIYPRPDYRLGFHVAFYYAYATNNGTVMKYHLNNISNFGLRVGVAF